MSRVTRSTAARGDLNAITFYVGRHDPDAAMRLLDRIDEVLHLLTDNPRLGPGMRDRENLRTFVVRPYVLIYRPVRGGIRLIRVLHGARDIAGALSGR